MMKDSVWRAPAVIGGQDVWRDDAIFERRNPADTGQIVTIAAAGNKGHAGSAVGAAFAMLAVWRSWGPSQRAGVCKRVATLLRERENEIALAMVMEVGKTMAGALGEVRKAAAIADFYGDFDAEAWACQMMPGRPGVERYVLMAPLGVVVAITAFNFPVALAVWKIIPAILAGNCVVYKPSELTPFTAYLLMKVFADAGLPDGVVNLVHGNGAIGSALIRDSHVKAVSFTGSVEVGRMVRAEADERCIRSVCEMGGLNAMMIMPDWGDRIPQFVRDVVVAAFSSTGQRCTATKRVLVHESIYDEVVEELLRQAAAIRVGPGNDPATTMEPLVSGVQLDRVIQMVESGVECGMRILFGGERITSGAFARGHYMTPTVLSGLPSNRQHLPLQKECFGPVVTMVSVRDFDHGLRVLNGTPYGHCASLYTDDDTLVYRFTNEAEVGMVHIREHTLGGDADMPFGGMKASMSGPPEMGHWGLDFFAQPKAVYENDGATVVAATQR